MGNQSEVKAGKKEEPEGTTQTHAQILSEFWQAGLHACLSQAPGLSQPAPTPRQSGRPFGCRKTQSSSLFWALQQLPACFPRNKWAEHIGPAITP